MRCSFPTAKLQPGPIFPPSISHNSYIKSKNKSTKKKKRKEKKRKKKGKYKNKRAR
jgi:hypothetical protein